MLSELQRDLSSLGGLKTFVTFIHYSFKLFSISNVYIPKHIHDLFYYFFLLFFTFAVERQDWHAQFPMGVFMNRLQTLSRKGGLVY